MAKYGTSRKEIRYLEERDCALLRGRWSCAQAVCEGSHKWADSMGFRASRRCIPMEPAQTFWPVSAQHTPLGGSEKEK